MTASLVFFGLAGPAAIAAGLSVRPLRENLIAAAMIYLANAPLGIAAGRRWRETWLLLVPLVGVVWMWHNACQLTGDSVHPRLRRPAETWSGGQ